MRVPRVRTGSAVRANLSARSRVPAFSVPSRNGRPARPALFSSLPTESVTCEFGTPLALSALQRVCCRFDLLGIHQQPNDYDDDHLPG